MSNPACPSDHPEPPRAEGVAYQRARFSTTLPGNYLYTAAHFWLRDMEPGVWRVGLTRFAVRLLGEVVEYEFEVKDNSPVRLGQVIGWLEAFKAVTDLQSAAAGVFLRENPTLADNPEAITQDCYEAGWLYEVRGNADAAALDVRGYVGHLDRTIDQLQGTRREEE